MNERAQKQQQEREFTGARELWLTAGNTLVLRVYGDFENEKAPALADFHRDQAVKGRWGYGEDFACGMNAEGAKGCLRCDFRAQGLKKIIGYAKTSAFVQVQDLQMTHKLEDKVRVLRPGVKVQPGKRPQDKDFMETRYPNCTAGKGKPCAYCADKIPRATRGHGFLKISHPAMSSWYQQYLEHRDYCRCGAMTEERGPTLYVSKYLCGNRKCRKPVNYSTDSGEAVASCTACKQVKEPEEVLACTACKKPSRALFTDFIWKATTTDGGKKQGKITVFSPVLPIKPLTQEDMDDYEENKIDFASMFVPEPAEKTALLHRLPCPDEYKEAGHGSEDYGNEDSVADESSESYDDDTTEVAAAAVVEEEEEEETYEEEEDEAPPAKAPPPPPRTVAPPRVAPKVAPRVALPPARRPMLGRRGGGDIPF